MISLIPVRGIPEVSPGDDLAALIAGALRKSRSSLRNGDVVVIAHKAISKSEGRIISLADVKPGARARRIARKVGKTPEKVEIILSETRHVIAMRPPGNGREGLLVCEHLSGLTSANAGVDESNTGGEGRAVLLPKDPDRSARRIRSALGTRLGKKIGVIITDSFGRPWRIGLVNVAIGVAGIPAVRDVRGKRDSEGRLLKASILALADEIAAAAGIAMGKLDRVPVVIVRGAMVKGQFGSARELLRPRKEDLFK